MQNLDDFRGKLLRNSLMKPLIPVHRYILCCTFTALFFRCLGIMLCSWTFGLHLSRFHQGEFLEPAPLLSTKSGLYKVCVLHFFIDTDLKPCIMCGMLQLASDPIKILYKLQWWQNWTVCWRLSAVLTGFLQMFKSQVCFYLPLHFTALSSTYVGHF